MVLTGKNAAVDLRTMQETIQEAGQSVLIYHARLMPRGLRENGFITRLTVRRIITRSNQKNMAITAVPIRIMNSSFVFSSVPEKKQSSDSQIVAGSLLDRSSVEALKGVPCSGKTF